MRSSKKDVYLFTALLCFTAFWITADQQAMAPSMTAIASEFGFTDQEKDELLGGQVSLGFFFVGGIVGLLVGHMVDTCTHLVSRTHLFAIVVLLGRMGSFGIGICNNYQTLLLSRTVTGVSIGGASPIIFSLLGDIWPASNRVNVAGAVGISMSFGAAGGQIISAYLAPSKGWRFPFLVMLIPSMMCVVLLLFITEPKSCHSKGKCDTEGNVDAEWCSEGKSGGNCNDEEVVDVEGCADCGTFLEEDRGEKNVEGGMLLGGSDSSSPRPIGHRNSNIGVGQPTERNSRSPPNSIHSNTPIAATSRNNKTVQVQRQIQTGERMSVDADALTDTVREILSVPTAVLVLLQGIFGCIPWSILSVYFNDFLQHDLRLSVHSSTLLMTVFGVGATVGAIGGGWLGQQLHNKDPRNQTLLMGLTTICATIPLLLIINSDYVTQYLKTHHHLQDTLDPMSPFWDIDGINGSVGDIHVGMGMDMDMDASAVFSVRSSPIPGPYIFALFFISGLLAAVNGPNVRAVLTNVTTKRNRGLAFALYVLCDDVGKGAGPYYVARLIAWTRSRKEAFNIGIMSWLLSGTLCLCMFSYVLNDTYTRDHHKRIQPKRLFS